MPRFGSKKREREYEELKDRFQEEDRYEGREKEVAARIVNKQRKQYGETEGEKEKDKKGQSPDRNLPIDNYQHRSVGEIEKQIDKLSPKQLEQVLDYEKKHKHRKTVLQAIDQRL